MPDVQHFSAYGKIVDLNDSEFIVEARIDTNSINSVTMVFNAPGHGYVIGDSVNITGAVVQHQEVEDDER